MSENRKDYFFWNKSFFESSIKRSVCPKCELFDSKNGCCNTDPRGCALFRYLPELVIIEQHLENPTLNTFNRQAETIRMACANTESHSSCRLNDTLECGLKKLMPFVLEAIEDTNQTLENRPGFGNYEY